ncbi:MAG: NAD-dependent epimerase/dehydratase family protein [Gammaproteobacteria bacterium]
MREFWNGRKALVTGAAGFIGRQLVAELHRLGAVVRAFVRAGGTTFEPADAGIEILAGDLLDGADCRKAVQGVDTVFHAAAVYRSFRLTRREMREVHVDATRQLLRESSAAGVRRFVHLSTIDVHGGLQVEVADETAAMRPEDDYQLTKLEGEQLVEALCRELGLPCTILRPCSVYGPGETRFMKFIRPISRGRFVMVGAGEAHVHFVYVDDLVQGMLLAAEKDEAVGETFIIGGPRSYSLNEFARIVANVLGVRRPGFRVPLWPVYQASVACAKLFGALRLEPPLHPRRVAFFTKHRSFSNEKARRLLGYEPQTGLESGLRKQIAWLRERGYM